MNFSEFEHTSISPTHDGRGYTYSTNTDEITLKGPEYWTVVIDEDPAPNPYAPIGESEAFAWTLAERRRLEEHRRREAERDPIVEVHDDFDF